uniref:Putative radical SAM superfamily protein n=1 Tax=viral metagenome TaxID=1070528 RepID=A0A6H1ZUL8_9ZZZZ
MKISFISPYFKNIWSADGIGNIVAYCKNNFKGNLNVSFFHGNFDNELDIINKVSLSDIAFFSCTTPTYKNGVYLASRIKNINKNIRIVFGGWNSSTVRSIEDDVIDQIVIGEGEEAVLSILNGNMNSIIYGTKLNFNSIPWPDRDLIKQNDVLNLCESMCNERIISIQSIRGCKFNCKMCGESCMSGTYNKNTNPLRIRDPIDVLDEIEYLQYKFKIDRIKLLDPTWAVAEDVVFAFCEEKIKRNNNIKFDVMVHAGLATEKSIEIMSKAYCDVIMVGCESGSQRVLNDIGKGITLSKIKDVFAWGRKYNIQRRAFFILGFEKSYSDIEKTKQLIRDISPDIIGVSILSPYPGTCFYDSIKYKDVDWSKVDEYNSFWANEYFTNQQLKDIQKSLNDEFKDILVAHQRGKINE